MLTSAAIRTAKQGSVLTMALLILGQSGLMAVAQPSSLHQSKPKSESIILHEQRASADNSKPSPQKLEARVEELRNLDISTPQTDWNSAYSIGRQAYIDGDFRRAFNAFQLAFLRTRGLPVTDARVIQTRQAIEQVRDSAESLPARAGFKTSGDHHQPGNFQTVERVFPGSLAWLSGVRQGDRIVSARSSGPYITLNVERDHKPYSVQLKDLTAQYDPRSNSTPAKLHGQITDLKLLAAHERLLANHDVIILVDKSHSMSARNCPGNLSVWDWCRLNTVGLLQSTQQYFQNHVTVIPFDWGYRVYKDVDVSQVERIFQTLTPSGGTNPEDPIANQLEDYFFRRSKSTPLPIIIVVITDGLPNDPEALRDVIFNGVARMHNPTEICITFLQVGNAFAGVPRILQALDDDLVNAGAKYDIVDTTSFIELQQIGMKNALVAALLKQQPSQQPPPSQPQPKPLTQRPKK
jgi:Mg-chelatase subunit ChlD